MQSKRVEIQIAMNPHDFMQDMHSFRGNVFDANDALDSNSFESVDPQR